MQNAGRRRAEALEQLNWARGGCAGHLVRAVVHESEDTPAS